MNRERHLEHLVWAEQQVKLRLRDRELLRNSGIIELLSFVQELHPECAVQVSEGPNVRIDGDRIPETGKQQITMRASLFPSIEVTGPTEVKEFSGGEYDIKERLQMWVGFRKDSSPSLTIYSSTFRRAKDNVGRTFHSHGLSQRKAGMLSGESLFDIVQVMVERNFLNPSALTKPNYMPLYKKAAELSKRR